MASAADRPRVLFLCTGNSCRSQMAEGWAKALRPQAIEAFSAGTDPHGLNPLAVRAMAEVGVDISGHTSKRPQDLGVQFDFVVTVCDAAHESCPVLPARTRVVHVGFDDPPRLAKDAKSEADALPHYRRVRDQIREYILTLPQSLEQSPCCTHPPSLALPQSPTVREGSPTKEKSMSTVKVFDPPMCCSSGVCGAEPDIGLARFSADLQWLRGQGVGVQRFNLTQQPEQFVAEAAIMEAVKAGGTAALPIVMVDGRVVAAGRYPSREELAVIPGLLATAAPTEA